MQFAGLIEVEPAAVAGFVAVVAAVAIVIASVVIAAAITAVRWLFGWDPGRPLRTGVLVSTGLVGLSLLGALVWVNAMQHPG